MKKRNDLRCVLVVAVFKITLGDSAMRGTPRLVVAGSSIALWRGWREVRPRGRPPLMVENVMIPTSGCSGTAGSAAQRALFVQQVTVRVMSRVMHGGGWNCAAGLIQSRGREGRCEERTGRVMFEHFAA